MRRRLLSLFVILCMGMSTLACPWTVFGNTAKSTVSWETAMTKTEVYIGKQLAKPAYGSEWTVTAMARDGGALDYDAYYKDVAAQVKAAKGVLDARKALPYTKVILALTAMGKDPQNVGGYNLLESLADFDKVMLTGTNGPVFALLALDCGKYEIPTAPEGKTQTTRELLIDTILERELEGGGFTVGMSSNGPETDITAMAIQALAPYDDRTDVAEVIERALTILSAKQGSDGCFSDYGTKSAESIAQVMIALMALDLDPAADGRFVKNGNSLLDALMLFYDNGGGFKHVLKTTAGYDAPVNGMATEQAYLALGAYKRFLAGENFIYDMTDGVPVSRPVAVTQKTATKGLKQAKISWNKVSGVKGYQIRYGTSKSFKSYKTVNVSASVLSRTFTGLSKDKTYYFKIRAYKVDADGQKVYGQFGSYKSVKPDGKVTSLALKSPKKKQLKVSWKKVPGAKGYQVRYAANKSFKNSKTVYVSSKYSAKTLSKLISGKRYYVKVRAYTKSGSKKIYGAYSTTKNLKVK